MFNFLHSVYNRESGTSLHDIFLNEGLQHVIIMLFYSYSFFSMDQN